MRVMIATTPAILPKSEIGSDRDHHNDAHGQTLEKFYICQWSLFL